MKFAPTRFTGLWLIETERQTDERGYFARIWCQREFADHNLGEKVAQASLSFNARAGTLRGMHLQRPPHAEAKLVRCIRGALWDVAIDLRPSSKTYCQWQAFELTAENGRALYIPEGFAHGFQTLMNDTELLYQISEFYAPEAATGVRYDDPVFAIDWPLEVTCVSRRDATWPDFRKNALTVV